MATYRHVAIAISRCHLAQGGFKRDYDIEDSATDGQTAHTSWTAGRLYARGLEEAPTLLFLPEPRRASKIYPSFPKVAFVNRVALPDSPSLPKVAPRKRVAAPKFFEPRRGQIRGPNPSFRERSGEATQADVGLLNRVALLFVCFIQSSCTTLHHVRIVILYSHPSWYGFCPE